MPVIIMVVIHVTGTTGSGKSWIGLLMKRIYPDSRLHVVDLDSIFRDAIKRSNAKTADEKFLQIESYVRARIKELRQRHKNILLTGYSDVVVDGKVRYVELDADEKFFIEIPTKHLIQQYRWRASQHVAHTRHEARTLADDELQRIVAKDRKVYKGFRPLPQAQIVQAIILRIGK
jgi:shikimate kinase